jgi:hypothetical protein
MARQVQQCIDLGHCDVLRPIGNLDDLVSRADVALFKHAAIKSRSPMRDQQRRHTWVIHPDANAVAGHSWLRHFEEGRADTIAISDTDLIICKALDGEVLSKLSVFKVVPLKVFSPIAVRVKLVDHHCAMLAAMTSKISLPVTIEIESPRHHPSRHRSLPHGSTDDFALPRDILRKSDVH